MEKSDHDLLIELNTKMELWHNEHTRIMSDHMKDDVASFTQSDMKVNATHRRLDEFKVTLDNYNSLKDKVLGGAAVLMFLFSSVVSVIALIKH